MHAKKTAGSAASRGGDAASPVAAKTHVARAGPVDRQIHGPGARPDLAEGFGILARRRAEWVQADFAIFSAGGVTVPIYPTSSAEEIAYIVNDATVRTLIVERDTTRARWTPAATCRASSTSSSSVGKGEPGEGIIAWGTLRGLGHGQGVALESPLAERIAAARADDVATIVYTSGTTGAPKGVVQTQGNLTLDRDAVQRFARIHGLPVTEWAALVRHPAVLDHVRVLVEATNESLPSHARIRRFAVAPEQFTEAGGELTPTQKVKRRVVAERYHDVLDGLYR